MTSQIRRAGGRGPTGRDFDDLATLNEIVETLNRAVDVRSALDTALVKLVELMGLESGLVYVKAEGADGLPEESVYELAAQHNLPPAMAEADAESWATPCRCQRLCDQGELSQAINVLDCSRLAGARGETRGLTVHASVALRAGERSLGILNVIAHGREAFGERELALLTNVGAQMGIALERARLYDMLRERRVEEQAALLDLSSQLLTTVNLDDVMDCVVDEARRLLGADASALMLLQGEADHLVFRAASGWRLDPVAGGVELVADEHTGPGLVLRSRQALVFPDVEDAHADACAWASDIFREEGFRSHALASLVADDREIGVLMVDSRRPRAFAQGQTRFLQLLANQAAIAIETGRLREEELRRRQLDRELAVAREIQLGLLPQSVPELSGWGFGVAYQAARQVGGDFYDIFELADRPGEYGLVIADVADKGVPASLLMAVTRTLVRATAVGRREPASTLELVNTLLLEESQAGLFVTVLFAILNPRTGQLCFSNGGHVRPLRIRASGEVEELSTAGMALGVMPQIELPEREIVLQPGDLLVIYTDGVTDAVSPAGERYGRDRLQAAIRSALASGEAAPQALVSAVRASVEAFAAGAEQADDLTILALGRAANG